MHAALTQLQQLDPAYQQLFFIGLSVLFVVVGLPFALNAVPPNRLSGCRTRKTLSDPRIWYLVNSYFGRLWVLLGVITFVLAVVLRATAVPTATYVSTCGLVLFGGLVLTLVATLIYMKRI